MAGHVSAAVIGELAGRAVSKVLATLGSDRSGVDEKLRRLKMLVIKLRSTVEVSEKIGTETASLLEWRDKLKEAAAEGHEVLLRFQQPATPEAHASIEAAKGHHQGENTCGAMSATRNALQGVARGVRNAAALLLAGGEGAENLNSTVDRLEKVCADVGEFISLLQAEALTPNRPNKRKRAEVGTELENAESRGLIKYVLPDSSEEIIGKFEFQCCVQQEDDGNDGEDRNKKIAESSNNGMSEELATTSIAAGDLEDLLDEEDALGEEPEVSSSEKLEDASATKKDGLAEELATSAAAKRLNSAVAEITTAVEMADGREFSELECLTEWADVLREAKAQGHGILRIVSDAKSCKQAEEGHQENLLCSAVENMENLALDVGWFTSLVSLCTTI